MNQLLPEDRNAETAREIVDGLKARLGETFTKLAEKDRSLLGFCAADAAELYALFGATKPDTPAHRQLVEELKQVKAQLLNLGCAEAADVSAAFWDSVRFVAGQFIQGLAIAAVAAV